METVFAAAAAVGVALLVCQFAMSLLGWAGDHDDLEASAGHDVHAADHVDASSWFAGVLTLRAITAGLAFFGLLGLAGTSGGWGTPLTVGTALASGAAAVLLTSAVLRLMKSAQHSGTLPADAALGAAGTVYLTVPAGRAGIGKVQLNVRNRTVEYAAVSGHHTDLPAGTPVVVARLVDTGTVEVSPSAAKPAQA
jgi:hypothetical protein